MNTITIELCAEDRKRLDDILVALQGLKPNCHSCTETAMRVMADGIAQATEAAKSDAKPEAAKNDHPVEAVPPHAEPAQVEAPKPIASQYTQDDIRAVVQRLIGPGSNKREKAQAIVKDYAPKLSAIPVEKYPEVMARLIALEKEG